MTIKHEFDTKEEAVQYLLRRGWVPGTFRPGRYPTALDAYTHPELPGRQNLVSEKGRSGRWIIVAWS